MVCTATASTQEMIAAPDTDGSLTQTIDLCGFAGEGGVEGDGDITRPENMTAFRNFVMESTEKRGLHFLMADGVRAVPCYSQSLFCKKNRKLRPG